MKISKGGSENWRCDRQRGIFALSKTFFRRNTDIFQGKMVQRSVKRSAVRVRWELEEYTLGRLFFATMLNGIIYSLYSIKI